ncbi:MAG TPA: BadF/BadG/BcrA/BcrD ATPase family protein, partial [Gammaproteobacteria bacterium]|nr:BadF/BadG/BcrA/BcrD ATPase family protein [Gammaproteobacteria bacterium]
MSQDIFIGVDGGGTKSKIRIEDKDGNVLGQAVGGPANIRISVENAWRSIYSTIRDILAPLNITLENPDYRFHACFGLAGCEVTDAYHAFLQESHPFQTLELISDAHAACVGAHLGQDGAIIIVGTGVVGYQALSDINSRVGGWGFPHDDEGGG